MDDYLKKVYVEGVNLLIEKKVILFPNQIGIVEYSPQKNFNNYTCIFTDVYSPYNHNKVSDIDDYIRKIAEAINDETLLDELIPYYAENKLGQSIINAYMKLKSLKFHKPFTKKILECCKAKHCSSHFTKLPNFYYNHNKEDKDWLLGCQLEHLLFDVEENHFYSNTFFIHNNRTYAFLVFFQKVDLFPEIKIIENILKNDRKLFLPHRPLPKLKDEIEKEKTTELVKILMSHRSKAVDSKSSNSCQLLIDKALNYSSLNQKEKKIFDDLNDNKNKLTMAVINDYCQKIKSNNV